MQTPGPGEANRRPHFTEGTMGRNWGVLNRRKALFDLLLKYHLGGCRAQNGLDGTGASAGSRSGCHPDDPAERRWQSELIRHRRWRKADR